MTARLRRTAVVLLLSAAPLVALAGCAPSGPGVDSIDALTFHQSQAVPNFDGATYTQTDTTQVQRFIALLKKDGVDPASYRTRDAGGCVGGLTTVVKVGYRDSSTTHTMNINGCGTSSGFESDANALFTGWKK